MSERGTHLAIAGARAGAAGGRPDAESVRAIVAAVPDPELPVVGIGDLGMVHRVELRGDAIVVTILPTFTGCPALDALGGAIADALTGTGLPVRVETTFEVPWSSDRITPAGLAALRDAGIAPPAGPADLRCPYCASARVVMDSAFGPTQCRSLCYCRDCRQPFEAMKQV